MGYRHLKKMCLPCVCHSNSIVGRSSIPPRCNFQSTMNLQQDTPPKWSKAIMMWWTRELTTPKGHSMLYINVYNIYLVSSDFALISRVFRVRGFSCFPIKVLSDILSFWSFRSIKHVPTCPHSANPCRKRSSREIWAVQSEFIQCNWAIAWIMAPLTKMVQRFSECTVNSWKFSCSKYFPSGRRHCDIPQVNSHHHVTLQVLSQDDRSHKPLKKPWFVVDMEGWTSLIG